MKNLALISVVLVLVATALLNLRPRRGVATYSPQHPLGLLAPSAPLGWTVEDTPISGTEGGTDWALNTLDLTNYFYKTYKHGDLAVRFYVAYWAPGRIDPRVVWSHQPDICWMSNGASILQKDNDRRLPGARTGFSLPSLFRVFQFSQGREEVVFWHLVGRHLSGYQSDAGEALFSPWKHFVRSLRLSEFGLAPQEQLVVRISTNHTIDQVIGSPLWAQLSASLGSSGIFEKSG